MGSKGIGLALAVLLTTASAAAAPSAAQRETARRLMDEGKESTREGDLARALDAYKKAHDIMHVPSTGIAVARTQMALGRLVEARDVALEVLRMPRDAKEPPAFEHARRHAKELEASLKARIPTVKIVVSGGPATRVTVDEGEVAPILLGEPVAMNPGKHTIVAKNADGIAKSAEVDLVERDAKSVTIELPAAEPHVIEAAVTPPPPDPSRSAWVEHDHRATRSTAADVLVYGGFGLAVVGVAVGSVAGGLTLSKADTVKPQCANSVCDPAARSDLDAARTLATVSTVGFAAAGVGLACGVVGLVLPKRHEERAAVRAPSTSPKASAFVVPGGVVVRGSF